MHQMLITIHLDLVILFSVNIQNCPILGPNTTETIFVYCNFKLTHTIFFQGFSQVYTLSSWFLSTILCFLKLYLKKLAVMGLCLFLLVFVSLGIDIYQYVCMEFLLLILCLKYYLQGHLPAKNLTELSWKYYEIIYVIYT